MKLALCIALLFMAAYAAAHLAPEPREELMPIEFKFHQAPGLKLPPDFVLPALKIDCGAYTIDDIQHDAQMWQRCPLKI